MQKELTEADAELYDRQIRLWGVDTQKSMLNSSLLVINIHAIAVEALKNVVLAGIGAVSIYDPDPVSQDDIHYNYFLRDSDIGKPRAEACLPRIRELNPSVALAAPTELTDTMFQSHDVILVTEESAANIAHFNRLARQHEKLFFASGALRYEAYIFVDLLDTYTYLEADASAKNALSQQYKPGTLNYVDFESAVRHSFAGAPKGRIKRTPLLLFALLALFRRQMAHADISDTPITVDAEFHTHGAPHVFSLRPYADAWGLQFSPIATVVGGILGQDILNVIGGKERPVCNMLVFDGASMQASVHYVGDIPQK